MAGLVHVPRMIDKARASNHNALGEYIFPCPLDDILLEFLQAGAKEFAERAESDPDIEAWVDEKCRQRGESDKKALNEKILRIKPDTDEKREKFIEIRNRIDPAREDVETWVDLIDLEEGRI